MNSSGAQPTESPPGNLLPLAAPTNLSANDDRWFREEIQPHESFLKAWLRKQFPRVRDIDDLLHDAYVRLFRARQTGTISNPKSFFFVTARNVALDYLRRKDCVPMDVVDIRDMSLPEEGAHPSEGLFHEQNIQLLTEAIEALPTRCRVVFKLAKLQDLSYREIAQRLGISENTVSDQMTKAIKRCRHYLKGRGVSAFYLP